MKECQATSGLLADGRALANRARDEAQNYRDTYMAPPPLKVSLPSDELDILILLTSIKGTCRSFRSLCPSIYPLLLCPTIWH